MAAKKKVSVRSRSHAKPQPKNVAKRAKGKIMRAAKKRDAQTPRPVHAPQGDGDSTPLHDDISSQMPDSEFNDTEHPGHPSNHG
jgi:hypothetical protein